MALSNAQWFANPGVTYEIDNSCRFDGSSSYMTKTFASAGNLKTWTQSFWMKRSEISGSAQAYLLNTANGANTGSVIMGNDTFQWMHGVGGGYNNRNTTQVFRDPGAWMHIVIQLDTTQASEPNRSKLWVNGEQVTAFSTAQTIAEDATTYINDDEYEHGIGRNEYDNNQYFSGYLAEFIFVDGTALDADSFGETNSTTGQWVPKDPSGVTFGSNGFWLDFANSSALGNDVSGNDQDWTTSGLAAADQMTDSPTNTVSTLNPLGMTASMVLSDGNLVATPGSTNYRWVGSTISIPSTGKWVFEAVRTAGSTGAYIGIGDAVAASGVDVGTGEWYCVNVDTGNIEKRSGGSSTTVQSGSGDLGSSVIRVEYNADDDEIQFFDDGSSMYSAATAGLSPQNDDLFFLLGPYATYSNAITATFNEDNFAGTPTTDFKGLSTSNFSDPTIANPTEYFETVLYTGSGSEKAITSLEFSPDFVWLKNRETTDQHNLIDTVRGATKEINSDNHQVESTVAQGLKSFDSNGFTLGTDLEYNTDTETYVSWNWLESVTAGFDIVGWTGDGESSKTLSHNLGVVPDVMMVKNRGGANSWRNFHSKMASDPQTDHMVLDTNLGVADDGYGASSWNDTMPTSSNFYVGDSGSVNTDTENYIAYLWANVEGFSKLGSYTGNGNVDGPFVWCGLSPSFVMTKGTAAGNWKMWDNKRIPYNVITTSLAADTTAADNTGTAQYIDFLSNGFKIRGSDTATNGDGTLYIFMAFAESPFKTANAR